MKEKIILDTDYKGEDFTYTMTDGTQYHVKEYFQSFWEKILKLPVNHRIQLLSLTEENVEDNLNAKRLGLSLMIKEFLKYKWKYRETGDDAILDDLFEFEFPHIGSTKQLRKDIKQKQLTIKMLQELHDYFNNQEKVYR